VTLRSVKSKSQSFDPKDKIISALEDKVRNIIIKSIEKKIRKLEEEVISLIKKTTFDRKSLNY
jgi:hypothetical protein